MSNSSLAVYKKISPNRTSPRNHVIDTISIHCVVGQLSVETLGNVFAPTSARRSANYGIGADGRIGMYVEEKDRSWCSSSRENDNRAITIECASDTTSPYAVNDKVYEALINLLVDVCQRNGIKSLKWQGKKDLIGQVDKQNMTVHRWFAAKACPGDYLYNLHGQIAKQVNERLSGGKTQAKDSESAGEKVLYKVQTGAYSRRSNAEAQLKKVRKAGFDACMVQIKGLYKIQVGAYSNKRNAEAQKKKLKSAGFDAIITVEKSK